VVLDVEVVDVDVVVEPVVVVVEPVVVVVVHGAVTVIVEPGAVTVTVFVLVFGAGQRPILSPRRRCVFTALRATTIETSFFLPVRWHIATLGFFFPNDAFPATAIDPARPATNSARRPAFSFKRLTPLVRLSNRVALSRER
jgi:hypothetical protein